LPAKPKEPQLQRATRLRAELRRSLAEVDVLLRKAEELLRRNRRSSARGDRKLFEGWRSHRDEDEA
jgi:hypothetical protein